MKNEQYTLVDNLDTIRGGVEAGVQLRSAAVRLLRKSITQLYCNLYAS